jgi:hypothetical protein
MIKYRIKYWKLDQCVPCTSCCRLVCLVVFHNYDPYCCPCAKSLDKLPPIQIQFHDVLVY